MKKLLAVDDEPEILSILQRCFRLYGYNVLTARSGKEALDLIHWEPDIILLDVMMPDMDGFEVCQKIRDQVQCPILFLTAKNEHDEKIFGFSVGADDYVVKPFDMEELAARVEAHIRRDQRKQNKQRTTFQNELTIDHAKRTVTIDGTALVLTRKEYDLIEKLALNPNRVFSKEDLYVSIWGPDKNGSNDTVVEHISKLRMKLAKHSAHEYIKTVWGCGYTWNG